MFTPSGCKYEIIEKPEFMARTQVFFLILLNDHN